MTQSILFPTLNKFIIFCGLFFTLQIAHSQTELAERKINIPDYKGIAKSLIDKISQQENIIFAYSSEVSLDYEVNIAKQKISIDKLLEVLFAEQKIAYKASENKILLYKLKENTLQSDKKEKITISARVRDSETKEALAFCNIAVNGTKKGAITNIDGVFSITLSSTEDKLNISYLGYEPQSVIASLLIKKPEILLKKKEVMLKEVVIHSNDEYLYDLMNKCRHKLLANEAETTSKVYFGLETRIKLLSGEYSTDSNWIALQLDSVQMQEEKPVELLECLYNADIEGNTVKELGFKNGRIALASNNNYFINMGSSKAITELSLTKDNGMYPLIPLQMNGRALAKNFIIEQGSYDGRLYNLKFKAKNKKSFDGELWIDSNYNLIKIHLIAENTEIHPFLPNFPRDTIKEVCFEITNTYKTEQNLCFPDHFVFNYSIKYLSRKDSSMFLTQKRLNSIIKSKSIMYFYDYEKAFILPYFDYTDNLFGRDDSYKISFIPYNETLWNNENIVLLTEKQKKEYGLLTNEGQLKNYREENYSSGFLANLPGYSLKIAHFAFYYPYWDSLKRVIPSRNGENFKTLSKEEINSHIKSDLYKLKAQILLDIVETGNTLQCKTYTVFDNEASFYYLETNNYTNAFLNIFFDLWEIERRKLQEKLETTTNNMSDINKMYDVCLKQLDVISEKYFNEVDVGENEKMLKKWNDYVLKELNIDNMKLVDNTNESKEKGKSINRKMKE